MSAVTPVGSNVVQVTVDDFDPLISYDDYTAWTTPDPSLNPTWFNETQEVTGSPWHQGEPHLRKCVGVLWKLTISDVSPHLDHGHGDDIQFHVCAPFNSSWTAWLIDLASSIAIYGAGTNYTVAIDSSSDQPYKELITGRNESGRNVLYSTDQLTYSPHTVQITNQGESLLLDLIVFTAELGAEG